MDETVFGPSGIVEGAQSGLFVVDATTSEVSSSTKTREALAKHGIIFVDAPLTRTPAAAELGKASTGLHATGKPGQFHTGTLLSPTDQANTMVGANPDDFKALLPIFEAYCENVVYAGPPGHGLVLKVSCGCHELGAQLLRGRRGNEAGGDVAPPRRLPPLTSSSTTS